MTHSTIYSNNTAGLNKMKTLLATFLILIIGEVTGQDSPPLWPANAYCALEYTVTKAGTTTDITLLGCGNEEDTKTYGTAAVKAAGKYIYKPKIVDGVSVDVKNVKIKIGFWKEIDTDIEINNDVEFDYEGDYIKPLDTIQPPK